MLTRFLRLTCDIKPNILRHPIWSWLINAAIGKNIVLYATDFGTSAVNAGWSWPSSVDSYRAFFCTYPTVLRTTRIASLIRKSISMNRTQLPPDYRVKKCSPEDMGRMGYPGCFSSVAWSLCGGSAGIEDNWEKATFFGVLRVSGERLHFTIIEG